MKVARGVLLMAILLARATCAAPNFTVPDDKVLIVNSLSSEVKVAMSYVQAGAWHNVHVINARHGIEINAERFLKIVGESEIYQIDGGVKYVIVMFGGKRILKRV